MSSILRQPAPSNEEQLHDAAPSPRAPGNARLRKPALAFFVLLYGAVLLLPAVQIAFRPLPGRNLAGVPLSAELKELSLETLRNETFQQSAESWTMKKGRLWGWLVRIDNQINYSLFNQISSGYGSSVFMGRDKRLFQTMYMNSFNRSVAFDPGVLEARIIAIKTLQDLLQQRGVALVALISTNSIAIHPEIVPEKYTDPTRLLRPNSYQIIRPLLDKHGINYVDAHELLEQEKYNYPFALFAPTGSHWNDVAACAVAERLIAKIETLIGRKTRHIRCGDYQMRPRAKTDDTDLLRIVNLLFGGREIPAAPYTKSTVLVAEGSIKPRILIVGTSFMFSLLRYFERHRIFERADLYFYYRKLRNSQTGSFRRLDKSKIDWQNGIPSKHAIVLEINQGIIENLGFKFVDDALANLSKAPG